MRLLIYIEPTSYLMPLWREIKLRTPSASRILFLEENLTQDWGINTQDDPAIELLRGGRLSKLTRVLQLIGQRDVELVHLAGWGHPLLLAALVAAWLRRIPVTMESDTPLPVGLPLWKRAAKRLLYPVLFKLPSRFLPGGSRQAAYLRHYGVADEGIVVAQMTVDVTAITRHVDGLDDARRAKIRRDLGLADETTVFLYVGRMESYKGVPELVEAFGRLSAGEERPPATLLLVGDGSMRNALVRGAKGDSHIRWPGRLSGTALLDAYAAADVFVLASRFEPWGLVVNEAMAAGLPVIATDRVGCVDDLVAQGVTGLVVPAGSPDALAAAMESLYLDRPLRDKMAQDARSLIAGWTLENEAEIVVNSWKRLLEH
jgi:glycosyltransferase involved in cell wall biosynthesis